MASVPAVIALPRFGSLKSILNIFRRGVVSLYESQNLNGPFAKLLPCESDCLKKRALRRLPPPSIARFFFCINHEFRLSSANLGLLSMAKKKRNMIDRLRGSEDVQSFLFRPQAS